MMSHFKSYLSLYKQPCGTKDRLMCRTTHVYCRRCPKKRHCKGQWFSSTLHVGFNELWSIVSSGDGIQWEEQKTTADLTKTSPMHSAVARWQPTRPVQSRSGWMCEEESNQVPNDFTLGTSVRKRIFCILCC